MSRRACEPAAIWRVGRLKVHPEDYSVFIPIHKRQYTAAKACELRGAILQACVGLYVVVFFTTPRCSLLYLRKEAHLPGSSLRRAANLQQCVFTGLSFLLPPPSGGLIGPFSQQPCFTCNCRVNTGAIGNINYGRVPFRWSTALVQCTLALWNGGESRHAK